MIKFKRFKKLMILTLAVVTVFSMAGITSFAEEIGGHDIDLSANSINIEGGNQGFIDAITTKPLEFTAKDKVSIELNNGVIYGTKDKPIQKKYKSNIFLTQATVLNFLWNTQKLFELDKYSFVNSIPKSINIPVPFYFQEGENSNNWIFENNSEKEGYSNTLLSVDLANEIKNLKRRVTGPDGKPVYENIPVEETLENGYSFKEGFFYTPQVEYYIEGYDEPRATNNNGTWELTAPIDLNYTVDIMSITTGGRPEISGLVSVENNLSYSVENINYNYFRNTDDANIGISTLYEKPDNSIAIVGEYGLPFEKDYKADEENGYKVAYVKVITHDPLTGAVDSEKKYNSKDLNNVPSTVEGQTEIRVAYGKEVEFTKVDNKGNPITGIDKDGNEIPGKAAKFTVYEDKDKSEEVGTTSYDLTNGKVTTPVLALPEYGQPDKTYYMEETKAPDGYEKSDKLFEITINSEGEVKYGNGFEEGSNNVVNPEITDPVITKTGSTPTHVKKGEFITYDLTVTNNYKNERDIVVKDVLPQGVSAVGNYFINDTLSDESWDGEWTGKIPAATFKENGVLDKPGKIVFKITVRVDKDYDTINPDNNVIKNKASLKTKSLTNGEYGEPKETDEVSHYLDPKISYTMEKERITQPTTGLKGFIAGAGEVIDYTVTLKNTGDLGLDINLEDIFEDTNYFTFVESNKASVTIQPGETKEVIFKAKVNTGTPEKVSTSEKENGYLNTVTSKGSTSYIDAENKKEVVLNETNWKEGIIQSTAETPVIEVGNPTITKTSDPVSGEFVKTGDKITYTLKVENPDNVVRDIKVNDNLPVQIKADGDYSINDKLQGKAWNGCWKGTIGAKETLTFEIPVTVVKSFNNKNHASNTILNVAGLEVKDLLTNEYGQEILTEEVIHYLDPVIGYTMTKERITNPDKGLDGFYAGTGKVIDYKVTLVNTGDVTLDVVLEDVFKESKYFEFVGSNKANVTIEPGETKEVIFQATIKANTPANANYENIVTASAAGSYVNAKTGETVILDKNNWPDAVSTAELKDDAITPVIVPVVPEKPSVGTGDNSSIALFGTLAAISGLALVLKRKKED